MYLTCELTWIHRPLYKTLHLKKNNTQYILYLRKSTPDWQKTKLLTGRRFHRWVAQATTSWTPFRSASSTPRSKERRSATRPGVSSSAKRSSRRGTTRPRMPRPPTLFTSRSPIFFYLAFLLNLIFPLNYNTLSLSSVLVGFI